MILPHRSHPLHMPCILFFIASCMTTGCSPEAEEQSDAGDVDRQDDSTEPDTAPPPNPPTGPDSAPPPSPEIVPEAGIVVDCGKGQCPRIQIDGDPFAVGHACLGGLLDPCPVSGNWDPSLETDADTGTVWLAYTGASFMLAVDGLAATGAGVNNVLLARSDDGGTSFQYVAPIALAAQTTPKTMSGTSQHEVSSLVHRPDGRWECIWFEYFDPALMERGEFIYSRKVADTPEGLENARVERYASAVLPSALGTPTHNLSETIPDLADCSIVTEPAYLKTPDGGLYFATNCIPFNDTRDGVAPTKYRIELLERTGETFSYVGPLLDHSDALDLGGDELTQADLAMSQTGEVLLIATIASQANPPHGGCYVFEVADLASASVTRSATGEALWSHHIISDGGHLGPGLCTYDAASDTGIVISSFEQEDDQLRGYLQASGVHP